MKDLVSGLNMNSDVNTAIMGKTNGMHPLEYSQ